jgi:hypothetical protein
MAFRAAPLPHEWMIVSIIGFFISLFLVYGQLGHQGVASDGFFIKWGFTFMLFFVIIFITSIVSMTTATTDPADLEPLAVHYRRR